MNLSPATLPLKMSADSGVVLNPKVGDRYSTPTRHYHTDIDKTPATCGDSLLSLQAIAD
jgi:hypothetical protein